jgi:hypothetical protein
MGDVMCVRRTGLREEIDLSQTVENARDEEENG